MIKHTLKILRCKHCKIFKLCGSNFTRGSVFSQTLGATLGNSKVVNFCSNLLSLIHIELGRRKRKDSVHLMMKHFLIFFACLIGNLLGHVFVEHGTSFNFLKQNTNGVIVLCSMFITRLLN